METTRAERIKIGAFMLLCGIMICIFLGYVLSRFLNKEYDNYYTVFSESVIGLYKDAQVKLNGIDVGNVTEIAIDSSNLNQVIVHFRVNKGTPIKIGTRAGMTHGISLTGEKQIVLSGGRFDEPDVAEGGYVPAAKTAFDAMRAGDKTGTALVKKYIKDLGEGIVNYINIFQPEIILIGGSYLPHYSMSVGTLTQQMIRQFHFDKAFISCTGADIADEIDFADLFVTE